MIVVCDASPLNYLILIGAVDLLPALFDAVIVPPAVLAELRHPKAPPAVQAWAAVLPRWLVVQAPTRIDPSLSLDPGETEAISLAVELTADQLLADDVKARMAATARGLGVTGTLGVLIAGSNRGLVQLHDAATLLQQTSFRATPAVWRRVFTP